MTSEKIKGIYSDLSWSVSRQGWNYFYTCGLHHSTYRPTMYLSDEFATWRFHQLCLSVSHQYVCLLGHSSRIWLCDPMDCSPPGSSVHGILQARKLEWVAMPSSRESSPPRDRIHISWVSCIGQKFVPLSPFSLQYPSHSTAAGLPSASPMWWQRQA